jgi:hypothetical protein
MSQSPETVSKMKRGRSAKMRVCIQSGAPPSFVKCVTALAKKLGAEVASLQKAGKCDRALYVGSYEHEWDDEELNQAFASCEVVTLGFLERLTKDAATSPLQSMLPLNHALVDSLKWWPRKERCEEEERAFPQRLMNG